MSSRVDLFTTIHKGIRTLLFDLALEAGRVDPLDTAGVDALVARVERAFEFLDEHAAIEDRHVLPALRTVAPAVAATLAGEHRAMEALQLDIGRTAEEVARAEPADRRPLVVELARLIHRLIAAQLLHMQREETEANRALWAALDDVELAEIRARAGASLPAVRRAEWSELLVPALSPAERLAMR